MIDNEREDYIVLRKDLYATFGLRRGMIVQLLINGNGEFIGSVGAMAKVIGIIPHNIQKINVKELIDKGVIAKEVVKGYTFRFTLKDESLIQSAKKKRKIPEKLMAHVEAIKKIREEKLKSGE